MHKYESFNISFFTFLCKNSFDGVLLFDRDLFLHVSLQPMHDDYDLRQEQLNKASLLSSKKFLENLLEKFITNVVHFFLLSASLSCAELGNWIRSCLTKAFLKPHHVCLFVFKISSVIPSFSLQDHGTGALVISSLLDFLTFALCAPYSETTEGQQFDMLLEMVASNGRTLFKLFQVGHFTCLP